MSGAAFVPSRRGAPQTSGMLKLGKVSADRA